MSPSKAVPPGVTIESAGMTGSRLLATPAEAAALDAAERAVVEAKNAELDARLGALSACGCCGTRFGAMLEPSGLCPPCGTVVARVRAERQAAEQIGGRSRLELANAYLDRGAG